jgi:hypothetical protein
MNVRIVKLGDELKLNDALPKRRLFDDLSPPVQDSIVSRPGVVQSTRA